LSQTASVATKLKKEALEAYLADPNSNNNLNDFLLLLANDALATEHYAEVLALAEPLIEHQFPNDAIYGFAGIAAFSINDFSAAEKYLKTAQKANVLNEQGRKDLAAI